MYTTNTLIGVWFSEAKDEDILVLDCEEVTLQKKRAKDAGISMSYGIIIQLM
jgi:hypothetical protein